MTIDSCLVGSKLKEITFNLEWRSTTNFAAAIDDANPAYLDDSRPGGIMAPLPFATAVTWPISSNIRDFVDDPGFPWDVLNRQVHYLEQIESFRPIRPGDTLTIGGEVVAILPRRSGTLLVVRYDAHDSGDSPVFTEFTGAILRGVECSDGGSGEERLPELPPRPGSTEPVWNTSIEIRGTTPFVYDSCTDIVFPIHTSQSFAKAMGLPGIILQGTACLSMASREMVDREADGDPVRLKILACRFTDMVLPGTSIEVRLNSRQTDKTGTHLFFEVLNGEGKRAISNGYALVATTGSRSCGTG